MSDRLSTTLTTWPFLGSLLLLLANDGWLKAAFPGVVTGKLSDFAGIAVVALLLVAAAPRRALASCAGLALFFVWWKSPASQAAIDLVSSLGPLRIARVVDYADLAALAILPACVHVARAPASFAVCSAPTRRVLIAPLAGLTLFAVVATSRPPMAREQFAIRSSARELSIERAEFAAAIREVAHEHGLACGQCADPRQSASYDGAGLSFRYEFRSAHEVAFEVYISQEGAGLFSRKTHAERAEELRAAVKQILALRFAGLEYVEPLGVLEYR